MRSTLLSSIAFLSTTGWAQYALDDDYTVNGNFFDQFDFYNGSDPTNGFVDYVERDYAEDCGLIGNNYGKAYMGVDHTGVASSHGRPAVRLESRKTYDSGLIVIDIEHMPGGICGTWPSFWMFGPNWPNSGEIDIIEGVNDSPTNDMTLHTDSGCSISRHSDMIGSVYTDNCDINAPGQSANQGCQITTDDSRTYGKGFNDNGGGVYATEIMADFINIFFFPRGSVPSDVSSSSPDPSSWGKPMAVFKGDCDIPSHFKNLQITFTNTFCGDWAGAVWNSGSCASKADTCVDYVKNNPEAFADAYWSINYLKVYKHVTAGISISIPDLSYKALDFDNSDSESSSSASASSSTSTSASSSASTSASFSSSTRESASVSPTGTLNSTSTRASASMSPTGTSNSTSTRVSYKPMGAGIPMPTGVAHDPFASVAAANAPTGAAVADDTAAQETSHLAPPEANIAMASATSASVAAEISAEARQRPDGWASRGSNRHSHQHEKTARHLRQHKRHGSGRL